MVPTIESWLSDVHQYVSDKAPDMLEILNIYEGESRFGRQHINADLVRLEKGAKVLEVGAGSLLLSCQLMREGFNVVALEPLGHGFTHFERLRKLILERAKMLDCAPEVLNQYAEDLSIKDYFDYAFSINVMEHVNDVRTVIENVGASLQHSAGYRFTCPNYFFPYEPHFNIPILLNKSTTEKIFRRAIITNSKLPDPIGTWKSLNWITTWQVCKILKQIPELKIHLNRMFVVTTLERIVSDREFALRRSKSVRIFILALINIRLHLLARFVPIFFHPVIDCILIKKSF
jgi:SAM-dependent methyltransferase